MLELWDFCLEVRLASSVMNMALRRQLESILLKYVFSVYVLCISDFGSASWQMAVESQQARPNILISSGHFEVVETPSQL